MSSTSGLARTRSLRRPGVGTSQLGQNNSPTNSDESKSSSPSRLPVKPLTRSATTATATATATARTRAGTTGAARPMSGVFSGKTSSTHTRGAPSVDQSAVSPSTSSRPLGRPPPARKGPSPTASTSSTSRIAPPSPSRTRTSGSASTSATPKTQPRGHTRTRSNVTSLTSATTLRPGSGSTPSSDAAAANPNSSSTSTSTRPQTRPPRAGHTRAQSATTRLAAATTSSTSASSRAPAATNNNNSSRPAFNTLQQHYSPLKSHAPKPLTSTFLAPPSPSKLPSNIAITAETSRLQSELLQLSLLHRDAGTVDAEWHASARSRLGDRFTELAAENDRLLATERATAESRNIAALVRWGAAGAEDGTNPDMALEDKIQVLDEVLGGVWSLGEPSSHGSGRYARTVRAFEAWADRAAEILAAQRAGDVEVLLRDGPGEDGDGDVDVVFLGDLDTSWKHDCAGLVRKLQGWRKVLRDLRLPDEEEDDDEDTEHQGGNQSQSSLARILGGCATLVHDMLAELAIMTQIEREATRAENAWIDKMNSELLSGSSETPGTKKKRAEDVALWKLVAS